MTQTEVISISQEQLVKAWNETLPKLLHMTDRAEVLADASDRQSLRIHIETEGRSDYSFDFKCHYVDKREVKVQLVDVEQAGRTVNEQTPVIQTLAEDYVRHIHECAQQLHSVTNNV